MGQDYCRCSPFGEGEKEESNTEQLPKSPRSMNNSPHAKTYSNASNSSSNSSSTASSQSYTSTTDDGEDSVSRLKMNPLQATDPNTPTENTQTEIEIVYEEEEADEQQNIGKLEPEKDDNDHNHNNNDVIIVMEENNIPNEYDPNETIDDQASNASKESPTLTATKPLQTSPIASIKSIDSIHSVNSNKSDDPSDQYPEVPEVPYTSNPPSPLRMADNPSSCASETPSPDFSFSPTPSPTGDDSFPPAIFPPISLATSTPLMQPSIEESTRQRSSSMNMRPSMIDVDPINTGRPRSASTPATEPPETPTLKKKLTKKRKIVHGFIRMYDKEIKQIMAWYIPVTYDDEDEDEKHEIKNITDYEEENAKILADIEKIIFLYYDRLTQPDEQVRILRNADYQTKSLEVLLDTSSYNFLNLVNKWSQGKRGDQIWNKLWTKLDKHNRAYIETHKELYRGIAMLLVIQKAIAHKKNNKNNKKKRGGVSNKFAYDKTMMEYTKHIGTWIVMKYGRKANIIEQNQLMTLVTTKHEFRTKLYGWLKEYRDINRKMRLDDEEMIAASNWDISDDRELQLYLGVIIRPKIRISVTEPGGAVTNPLYFGR